MSRIEKSLTDDEKEAIHSLYFSKSWKLVEKVLKKTADLELIKISLIDFRKSFSNIEAAACQGRRRAFRWEIKEFRKIALAWEKNLNKKKKT